MEDRFMRMSRVALVAVAGLCLAATACDGTGSGSASGSADASGASGSASAGAVAAPSGGGTAGSCVVGTWKSTGASGSVSAAGVKGTFGGGSGYTVTVAPDGATVVDFTGMQPATFATTVGGTDIKGSLVYNGKVTGAVRLPATSATSGQWEPTGTADFSSLRLTVDVTSPVSSRLADNVLVSQYTGETGGSVDTTPIMKNGTYECGTNTLTLGPPPNTPIGATWTLERA
jgi:hypothetical protein